MLGQKENQCPIFPSICVTFVFFLCAIGGAFYGASDRFSSDENQAFYRATYPTRQNVCFF